MEMLGVALSGLGGLISLVGTIWLAVIGFQKHWGWGIGCLCCFPAAIVFAIQNWAVAKQPFLIIVAGIVLNIIGTVMGGGAAMNPNLGVP